MNQKTLPIRSEVPLEETWNLEKIFSNLNDWEKAKSEVSSEIPILPDYKGRLSEGPEILGEFFEKYESAMRKALLVYVYGNLESSVDTQNQGAQARAGQGQSIIVQINAATAFMKPELIQIGNETLRDWTTRDQRLASLNHYFDDLERQAEHLRTDEIEEILALSGEPLSDFFKAYNALVNADLKFENALSENSETIEVGQSNIGSLLTHKDRSIRKTGFTHYAQAYLDHKNALASIQLGAIHKDVFNAKARNYVSSLEASLDRNKIPTEVFYAFIDAFKKNLPIWHRYWRIRKKALGYKELLVYDIKAPLSNQSPEIPFAQAVNWICEGMASLGEEYINILRKGAIEDRWVDRARNKGKRQGAFSSGVYDTNPFIMMSYANDIFSMSTLAHELGHSMHSYYSRCSQPFIYSHYSLFVAEVASNFNQAMVRDHLFKTQKDPDFQLALIEEAMSNFHRYFFIMPILAQWELSVHERSEAGKTLNADIMTAICSDLFAEGYGNEVIFDSETTGITWAQFQHMYMNFYVYQYATGISAAHALVKNILDGGQEEVDNYLNFLSAGGSVYPIDALKAAGVDMTMTKPVDDAFIVMASYIDRLEELVI
jgi:oligoendopeptidase F